MEKIVQFNSLFNFHARFHLSFYALADDGQLFFMVLLIKNCCKVIFGMNQL